MYTFLKMFFYWIMVFQCYFWSVLTSSKNFAMSIIMSVSIFVLICLFVAVWQTKNRCLHKIESTKTNLLHLLACTLWHYFQLLFLVDVHLLTMITLVLQHTIKLIVKLKSKIITGLINEFFFLFFFFWIY